MEKETQSLMKGFHRLTIADRLARVKTMAGLSDEEVALLGGQRKVPSALAENFIENVLGFFPVPLGVATYFRIDGRDVLIPMAVEETSIIAAASATAKWVCREGVITTYTKGRSIIGQVQFPSVKDVPAVRARIQESRAELIDLANAFVPGLVRRGGGVRDIAVREVDDAMLVLHVICDPCDAMGANLINQICEGIKPRLEDLTGEKIGMCIVSNLMDTKLAGAEVVVRNVDPTEGAGIEEATRFAELDPYRAATHNKGTLNGIDPLLVATGNDWRAVEAGIHTYAARSGRYQPITSWKMVGSDLVGHIEVPLAVGVAGGVTRSHPIARVVNKILGVKTADDLARICAAVGLVQNLGALRALSTVGIVKGHMALHASNLALAAGATAREIPEVKEQLTEILRNEKFITLSRARKILEAIRVGDV